MEDDPGRPVGWGGEKVRRTVAQKRKLTRNRGRGGARGARSVSEGRVTSAVYTKWGEGEGERHLLRISEKKNAGGNPHIKGKVCHSRYREKKLPGGKVGGT